MEIDDDTSYTHIGSGKRCQFPPENVPRIKVFQTTKIAFDGVLNFNQSWKFPVLSCSVEDHLYQAKEIEILQDIVIQFYSKGLCHSTVNQHRVRPALMSTFFMRKFMLE